MQKVKVLVLYYSLSGQSRGLVRFFSEGLQSHQVVVHVEQIKPQQPLTFPFKGFLPTFKMMLQTFLRIRIPIQPPSSPCFEAYDHIVLAGPTWSYNPSGPILSLIDEYGSALFSNRPVTPLISCRGYYRLHDYLLRKQLRKYYAQIKPSLIYTHPTPEPWSTIGLVLKSAGYRPERIGWLRNRYTCFGHTAEQFSRVREAGKSWAATACGKDDSHCLTDHLKY